MESILQRALEDRSAASAPTLDVAAEDAIAWPSHDFASGDARTALNLLEFSAGRLRRCDPTTVRAGSLDLAQLEQSIQRKAIVYDGTGDEHYDPPALIKSMRGSDPDAAVYWVARMLEAGEDPRLSRGGSRSSPRRHRQRRPRDHRRGRRATRSSSASACPRRSHTGSGRD